jgi:hypothetical protein
MHGVNSPWKSQRCDPVEMWVAEDAAGRHPGRNIILVAPK